MMKDNRKYKPLFKSSLYGYSFIVLMYYNYLRSKLSMKVVLDYGHCISGEDTGLWIYALYFSTVYKGL